MTPRLSLTGKIARFGMFDKGWKRLAIFVPIILILLLLSAFPEKFRAEATLTPADPTTLGLSDTLGQLGALNSVFGKQAEVEVALRIGTSVYTRDTVIREANLNQRLSGKSRVAIHRWLEDNVVIRSLRGGIILIQLDNTDRELARTIVSAYTRAIRERLAEITVRQTAYKRRFLEKLVSDSGARYDKAQAVYNSFRLQNGYADPERTVQIIGERVPSLRSQLELLDREIAAASNLYTADNIIIQQLAGQRAAVASELESALSRNPSTQEGTVGEAVSVSTKLFELERELELARNLYVNYQRYLEGTTVEDLASTANIRLLEQPYVSTERQYRWALISLAIVIFLIWLAIEFYRLRPPIGARIKRQKGVSSWENSPDNDKANPADASGFFEPSSSFEKK